MKSVLLHIHRDEGQESRLQVALDIVRAFEGHMTCLQATPFDTYLIGDPFGSVYALPEIAAEIRRDEEAERTAIEDRLKAENVSWDWLSYNGSAAAMLVDHSWLSELVVISPTPARDGNGAPLPVPIAADVALHARTPVLVVPVGAKGLDCGGPALIAWNGSREASQAVRGALPLLRMASDVEILAVDAGAEVDIPAEEAARFLSRHGVTAKISEASPGDQPVADLIREAAADRGVSYIVMGAYGHSRLRERMLGGVTRDMLEESAVPLLMAH